MNKAESRRPETLLRRREVLNSARNASLKTWNIIGPSLATALTTLEALNQREILQ